MDDAVANRLIADLEAGAALVDHGTFTLDEAAARRKLAEHRLVDPDVWACLVVEAASLLGSSWVRVRVWPRKLWLEFGGEPIDGDELFVQAIASAEGEGANLRLAVRKVAIAIDTALAHHRRARIEIASPKSTVTLRHEAANERGPGSGQHTILRVEGLETARAHEILIERCRHSPLEIASDSRWISKGLRSFLTEERCTEITAIVDGERTIGYAGWRGGTQASIVQLLTHGVASERLTEPRHGFVAIADVPLDKDIGERSVIRNDEFERVLALVRATFDAIAARNPKVVSRPARVESNERRHLRELLSVLLGIGAVIAGLILALVPEESPPPPRVELSAGETPTRGQGQVRPGDGQLHDKPRWRKVDDVEPIAFEQIENMAPIATGAGRIASLAILENGKLVSASGDRLAIWQIASLEPSWASKGTLGGHTDTIHEIAVLSTRHVVSASADQTARIWHIDGSEPTIVLEGHTDEVVDVMVTIDRRIVTMSRDRVVRVWDAKGQPIGRPLRAEVGVGDLATVWNGRIIDTRLHVWDLESNEVTPLVDGIESASHVVADSNGRMLLAYPGSVRMRNYDDPLSDSTIVLSLHSSNPVSGAALLRGRPVTISANTLRVWPSEGEPLLAFVGPNPFTAVTTWLGQIYVGDSLGRIWVFDPTFRLDRTP